MIALVILEGVVVALLAFLVIGLLKSHAEILRQLHDLGVRPGSPDRLDHGAALETPVPLRPLPGSSPAVRDLVGESPYGEAMALSVAGAGHHTLLAFLSSGCATCRQFWQAFATPERLGLPPDTRLVAVTRSPDAESVTAIRDEAPADLTVVMTTQGWEDYHIPGSPYFVLVDGPAGAVAGEGTGTSWHQIQSLMRQALGDRPEGAAPSRRRSDRGRMATDDAELLAAGIGPGHSSLFAGPAPPVRDVPPDAEVP
jgi:hypothetical protein